MPDTELSADLISLEASQFEISKIEELQKWHERLLHEKAEDERNGEKVLDVSLVKDFLGSLTDAGAVIQYPEYRSQLRALILYWSRFIEESTGTFPFHQLKPFDESKLMKEKAEAVEAERATVNRSITKSTEARADVNLLKKQLEAERLQNKEFQVTLSSTAVNLEKLAVDRAQALEEVRYLRELLEDVRLSNHKMELRELELEMKLREAQFRLHRTNWRAVLQLVITILGTVIFSIGVNLATSRELILIGWGMVSIGVVLEIVAFLIGLSLKPER